MGRKKYVYLEFSINTIVLGKVYFELFNDEEIRKSVENFLSLCKGNKYHSIYSDEMLSYKNCKIEKIKKNKCIKSGYLRNKITSEHRINNNISKETKYEKVECIYGKSYKKEYSKRRHLNAGLLTMVEIESKKYSSIFKITLNKVHKYNNKNIIIGRVIKNMHILRAIEIIPVTKQYEPKINVYISDCNEVSESFFKSEKISSRQLYIDNLFANLNEKKNIDDEDEDEDDDEEGEDNKYSSGNNDNYVFGKFQSKKKKKKEITEKQKGIELLNKILLDIDNLSKNSGILRENNEVSSDKLVDTVKQTNEKKISTNKISNEDKEENHENEKNSLTNKDLSVCSFEYNNLNKKMTEREKKLLNIQLKINQSKALNQMEVQREKLYENSNNEMKKFREYLNYKNEQNIGIKNATSERNNKREYSKNEDKDKDKDTNQKKEEESNENKDNGRIYESSDEENKINYKLYNTSAVKVKSIMKKKKKKGMLDMDNDIDLYKKIKFNFSINRKIYDEKKKMFGDKFYGNNLLINDDTKCTEKDKNKVLEFCKKQEELRSKFRRKRKEEKELFKNYINKRNKIYNKKLDRYFNKHTIEIRQNLERTT